MSVEDLQKTLQRLRTVELRGAIRGVDAEQARALLNEAADSLVAAVREQNELRRELERLRAANDHDAIGGALLVATRTGERIVAEARERAAAIVAEADAQASAALEQHLTAGRSAHAPEDESARAETDTALADARRELARLEDEAVRARSLVADTRRRAAQIIERALEELESPRKAVGGGDGAGGMLRALRPTVAPSEIAAD